MKHSEQHANWLSNVGLGIKQVAPKTKQSILPELKLDKAFGQEGMAVYSGLGKEYQRASAIRSDKAGSFFGLLYQMLGGTDNECAIVKFDISGNIDTAWGQAGYISFYLDPGFNNIPEDFQIIPDVANPALSTYIVTSTRSTSITNARDWTVAKIGSTGERDPHFGVDGLLDISKLFDMQLSPNHAVWSFLDANNSLYLVVKKSASDGMHSYVAKITPNGELDTEFHGQGYYEIGGAATRGYNICEPKVHADGKFYSLGNMNYGLTFFFRFTADWELDPTYGESGILLIDNPRLAAPNISVVENSIFAYGGEGSGNVRTPKFIKYNIDGQLDPNFNAGQPVITPLPDPDINFADWRLLKVLPNGSIVCHGSYLWTQIPDIEPGDCIAHFTPDGALDTQYEEGIGIGVTRYLLLGFRHSSLVTGDHRLLWSGGDPQGMLAAVFAFKI